MMDTAVSRQTLNEMARQEKSFQSQIEYRRYRWFDLLIFGFALTFRLISTWRLYAGAYGAPVTGDMKFYRDWGLRIASGHVFDPHAFYGQPLYAYVLGGLFHLFGFHPALMSIVQAIFDATTALLIFRIAVLVFEKSRDA